MKTGNNSLRNWLASGLVAGCLTACGPPRELEEETFRGILPGYGATELVVYVNSKTGNPVEVAKFTADLYHDFRFCSLIDYDEGGEFDYGWRRDGSGPDAEYIHHLFKGHYEFPSAENAVKAALAARGTSLKKVE